MSIQEHHGNESMEHQHLIVLTGEFLYKQLKAQYTTLLFSGYNFTLDVVRKLKKQLKLNE